MPRAYRFGPLAAVLSVSCLAACSDDPASTQDAKEEDAEVDVERDGSRPRDAGLDASRSDAGAVDASQDPMPRDAAIDAGLPRDAASWMDGGAHDAAADASAHSRDAFADLPTREVASPPIYVGTTPGNNTCNAPYRTLGHEPTRAGKYPLFLYFVGTRLWPEDESPDYASAAAAKVTEAMARRGFVALSVEYDNGVSSFLNDKFQCLYAKSNAQSLVAIACAMPNVDCARGIATWGHSQGGMLAHVAANEDERVRAVWTTGYGGNDTARLPADRFRVVNGEGDTMNAEHARLNRTAGFSDAECPDDGRDQCLRADGSGWILVRKAQSATNNADHCWFDKRNCTQNALTLEPNWVNPESTAAFALERNADWVAQTIARP